MRFIMRSAGTTTRRGLLGQGALCLPAAALILAGGVASAEKPLFLGVTTSTENSGLLAHLIEAFEVEHGAEIRAVTAGSGAVLNLASRGDVDVVLVHSPEDEAAFIDAGYGVNRRPVMRNHFVIVGPKDDPADVGGATDVGDALEAIADSGAPFLSRGDKSGTHRAELRLWNAAGLDPTSEGSSHGDPDWYRESGSGQGATLNIAANTGAYTLTDEATWATFGNRGDLQALYAREEPALRNIYSIIRVNPKRHPGVNAEDALTFADWLTSETGKAAILSFKVGGKSLFQPESRLAG